MATSGLHLTTSFCGARLGAVELLVDPAIELVVVALPPASAVPEPAGMVVLALSLPAVPTAVVVTSPLFAPATRVEPSPVKR